MLPSKWTFPIGVWVWVAVKSPQRIEWKITQNARLGRKHLFLLYNLPRSLATSPATHTHLRTFSCECSVCINRPLLYAEREMKRRNPSKMPFEEIYYWRYRCRITCPPLASAAAERMGDWLRVVFNSRRARQLHKNGMRSTTTQPSSACVCVCVCMSGFTAREATARGDRVERFGRFKTLQGIVAQLRREHIHNTHASGSAFCFLFLLYRLVSFRFSFAPFSYIVFRRCLPSTHARSPHTHTQATAHTVAASRQYKKNCL